MMRFALALALLTGTAMAQDTNTQNTGVQNTGQTQGSSFWNTVAYFNQECLTYQVSIASQMGGSRQQAQASATSGSGHSTFSKASSDSQFYKFANDYLTSLKSFTGSTSGQPASNTGNSSKSSTDALVINGYVSKAASAYQILSNPNSSNDLKQEARTWLSDCSTQIKSYSNTDTDNVSTLANNASKLISYMMQSGSGTNDR